MLGDAPPAFFFMKECTNGSGWLPTWFSRHSYPDLLARHETALAKLFQFVLGRQLVPTTELIFKNTEKDQKEEVWGIASQSLENFKSFADKRDYSFDELNNNPNIGLILSTCFVLQNDDLHPGNWGPTGIIDFDMALIPLAVKYKGEANALHPAKDRMEEVVAEDLDSYPKTTHYKPRYTPIKNDPVTHLQADEKIYRNCEDFSKLVDSQNFNDSKWSGFLRCCMIDDETLRALLTPYLTTDQLAIYVPYLSERFAKFRKTLLQTQGFYKLAYERPIIFHQTYHYFKDKGQLSKKMEENLSALYLECLSKRLGMQLIEICKQTKQDLDDILLNIPKFIKNKDSALLQKIIKDLIHINPKNTDWKIQCNELKEFLKYYLIDYRQQIKNPEPLMESCIIIESKKQENPEESEDYILVESSQDPTNENENESEEDFLLVNQSHNSISILAKSLRKYIKNEASVCPQENPLKTCLIKMMEIHNTTDLSTLITKLLENLITNTRASNFLDRLNHSPLFIEIIMSIEKDKEVLSNIMSPENILEVTKCLSSLLSASDLRTNSLLGQTFPKITKPSLTN